MKHWLACLTVVLATGGNGNDPPLGLAWEPGSNRLIASENGAGGVDEPNVVVAGGNGWPVVRGLAGDPGPAR